jgi:ribonuclease G
VLVINAAGPETRVALVENGTISEFYLERKKDKGIVGNIYKGKVVRVLPGMQAAFVDIGLEKAAFLYVGDVAGGPDFSESFELSEAPEGEHGEPPMGEIPAEDTADSSAAPAENDTEESDEEGSAPEEVAAESAAPAVEAAPAEVVAEAAPAPEAPVAPVQGEFALSTEAPPAEATPAPVEGEGATATAAAVEATAEEKRTRFKPDEHRKITAKPIEPLAKRTRRPGAPDKREKIARSAKIEDLLKEGQEVIVQVVKDPIGSKGARVTCHISLPGRHLVFMPTVDHVGISRRIENEKERRRLRELVDGLRPAGTGFIVRTVADGVQRDKLTADIKFLLGLWNEMAGKKDRLRAPALLHPDLDLILRSIRDLFSAEVEKLVIDDRAEYDRIKSFVDQSVPHLSSAIELYDGNDPIFDAFGIEQELQRALSRKVWLKSGGYLVIDQAEALVAIDINSGRFVGKKNLEETITAINIEAAKEIVYQLRLRNLGGMIIIDFIDMEKQPNREKVFKALQEAMQKDRAKTNIVKISELGLVEMTRKRVRESVGRLLHEPCAVCDGRGYMKSKTTVAYEIFREIQREATARREDTISISCHPEVAKYIQQEEREALRNLMMRFNRTIQLVPKGAYHQEQFDVQVRWSRRDEQQPKKEKEKEKEKQPAAAPVIAATAAVAADDDAEGDDEGDEDDQPATPGAPTNGAPAVAGAAPGAVGPNGRRRRRRRRGRGGGAGGGGGGGAGGGGGGQPGSGGGGGGRPAQGTPGAAARPPSGGGTS